MKWWQPNGRRKLHGGKGGEMLQKIGKKSRIDLESYLDKKVVFFGHYWLKGKPVIENNKAICLDYSVAKGGLLVAFKSEFLSQDNQKVGFVTNTEE